MNRDIGHAPPSGTTCTGRGPDGVEHVIPHVYRFSQGFRPDHAAALDGRPDLGARLRREGIDPEIHWSAVSAEELDAAIDAMLAKDAK